jgi:hypothetical protein
MLLPTNDGFVGLDSLTLPTNPGTYLYTLNGYDAGTKPTSRQPRPYPARPAAATTQCAMTAIMLRFIRGWSPPLTAWPARP